MHVEGLNMVKMEFTNQEHSTSMMVDPTVTSECGIQAASDTVCRGAQVTPLTRDAGCQYEDSPTPMVSRPLVAPNIIKPSPIKHNTSPPRSDDSQAMFMAAKALHQLHQTQSPTRSTPTLLSSRSTPTLLSSSDVILQSQIKAMQTQALHDSLARGKSDEHSPVDSGLLRGIGFGSESESSSLMSILQPGLMNTLPLTSYALLLDMLNRQAVTSSTNSNIVNHLSQLQQLSNKAPGGRCMPSSFPATTGNLVKPTPTILNTGGLCSVNSTSTVLNSGLVSSPTTLSSAIFSNKTALSNVGGLLNGSTSYLRGPSPAIPTMLGKQNSTAHYNQKRCLSDTNVKREMDIESLVDSVIDEHMSTGKHDNSTMNEHHHNSYNTSSQNCIFNRDIMTDYEMTPPFKRRRRTVFTERQLQGLEEAYSRSQYLDRESRLELCKKLSLSLHTVVYWFQNKRAISRRRGQPLENNSGINSNSSSTENIHAFSNDNFKNFKNGSPPFKHSPPHSPNSIDFSQYSASTSPLKASMVRSMVSPPSSRSLMTSPPSSMTNMSATLTTTSAISKNVLNINQMVGATI